MRALARRHLRDAEVDDAVQDAFISLWQSAHRYDPSLSEEATFVAMIARRRILDRFRRDRDAKRTERGEPLLVEAPTAESSPDCRRAVAALEELPEARRTVLLLSIGNDLSHGEIAERTGMPLGTVKSHFRRGLDLLRTRLRVDAPPLTHETGGLDDA